MDLIAVNNVRLEDRIEWSFRFNSVSSTPSIRFAITQQDKPERVKYVDGQNISTTGNKVKADLLVAEVFQKNTKDTTVVQFDNKYTISEMTVSYNDGVDIIEFSVPANEQIDEYVNNQQQQVSQNAQTQIWMDNDTLRVYIPTFLNKPFNNAKVYIAQFKTEASFKGFSQPQQATQADLDSLFKKDSNGAYSESKDQDGMVFILSEEITKGKTKTLKAIEPVQIKLFRNTGALAWFEEFDLENNSPIISEELQQIDAKWVKKGLSFEKKTYGTINTDDLTFSNLNFAPEERNTFEVDDFDVVNDKEPDNIQQPYTLIVVDGFGAQEEEDE